MKKFILSALLVISLFVFSACGEPKFSGAWEVNGGEFKIEFLSDEKCILDGDTYNYEVLKNNKIIFSDGWEDITCVYEITDKSNKKMTLDEYD